MFFSLQYRDIMESTVRIELWHGGKFDEQNNNLYRGGKKFVIPDVDLDRFCLDDLFDMLKAAGGQQMNAPFSFNCRKMHLPLKW